MEDLIRELRRAVDKAFYARRRQISDLGLVSRLNTVCVEAQKSITYMYLQANAQTELSTTI